jgi:hypothetical protein
MYPFRLILKPSNAQQWFEHLEPPMNCRRLALSQGWKKTEQVEALCNEISSNKEMDNDAFMYETLFFLMKDEEVFPFNF